MMVVFADILKKDELSRYGEVIYLAPPRETNPTHCYVVVDEEPFGVDLKSGLVRVFDEEPSKLVKASGLRELNAAEIKLAVDYNGESLLGLKGEDAVLETPVKPRGRLSSLWHKYILLDGNS